jgi:acyl dehydratase
VTDQVKDGYFEDFVIGDVYRHPRGKTITDLENVGLTNMVLNTAQSHFNEHYMASTSFAKRLVFGGVTIALTVGLSTEDTSAQAIQELGMDKVRLLAPVFHGDTIYAYTEVIAKAEGEQSGSGVVTFRHWGVNQRDEVAFQGERTLLVKRRPQ